MFWFNLFRKWDKKRPVNPPNNRPTHYNFSWTPRAVRPTCKTFPPPPRQLQWDAAIFREKGLTRRPITQLLPVSCLFIGVDTGLLTTWQLELGTPAVGGQPLSPESGANGQLTIGLETQLIAVSQSSGQELTCVFVTARLKTWLLLPFCLISFNNVTIKLQNGRTFTGAKGSLCNRYFSTRVNYTNWIEFLRAHPNLCVL